MKDPKIGKQIELRKLQYAYELNITHRHGNVHMQVVIYTTFLHLASIISQQHALANTISLPIFIYIEVRNTSIFVCVRGSTQARV